MSWFAKLLRRLRPAPVKVAVAPIFGGAAAAPVVLPPWVPPPSIFPYDVPPQAPAWTNAELESAIESAPDDRSLRLVWADALLAHGDARGELIVAEQGGQFAEVWSRVAPSMLADLAPHVATKRVELQWAHGLVRGASISEGFVETTRRLLDLPIARFLDTLQFENRNHEDEQPLIDLLTQSVRGQALRSLSMHRTSVAADAIYQLAVGCRKLQHLTFEGNVRWWKRPEPCTFSELRSLVFSFEWGLSGDGLRNLKLFSLPKLERFELLFVGDRQDDDDGYNPLQFEQLRPWAMGEGLDHVTHFALTGSAFTAELLDVLSTSPMTKRLRVLDLSDGRFSGGDVERLLDVADRFSHLERLDLSANRLDEAGAARILARLPNARLEHQKSNEPARQAQAH